MSLWGDFGIAAARCQRTLGIAATQCALAAVTVRRTCVNAQLAGAPCDGDAEAAALLAVRERALDRITAHCSDVAATRLQFLGIAEALADTVRICRELETALITAAYGPAMVGLGAQPTDAPTRECLTAVAGAVARTLRLTARAQRAPLDRIAAQALAPAQKDLRVARARARIATLRPILAARIGDGCRAPSFSELYGREVEAFASDITRRAECLAGAVYVQDTVVCPPPRCGNGMQEPEEECDDGDADDSDWCRNDCRRAPGGSSVVGHPSSIPFPFRPTSDD